MVNVTVHCLVLTVVCLSYSVTHLQLQKLTIYKQAQLNTWLQAERHTTVKYRCRSTFQGKNYKKAGWNWSDAFLVMLSVTQ